MNLAEKLKIFRKRAHFTQQELADAIGVSIMTVRRWEWNDRTPRLEEIDKIAAALGTTTDYLLNGESESAQNEPPKNQGNNLHIDNASPENNLGLGYWGSVVDNARKVANNGDGQEKNAVLMMLKMAADAITGEAANSTVEKSRANIFQNAGNVHGNVNQSIETL